MSRRKAREIALQTLFSLDFNQSETNTALEIIFSEHENMPEKSKSYAELLVTGVIEHLTEIDELINKVSMHWKIERMGSIDRNITRLTIFEMNYGEERLLPNMAINEAIEVAKVFGGEESSKFINGILGKLVKRKE